LISHKRGRPKTISCPSSSGLYKFNQFSLGCPLPCPANLGQKAAEEKSSSEGKEFTGLWFPGFEEQIGR
jgi:hypothetical protein